MGTQVNCPVVPTDRKAGGSGGELAGAQAATALAEDKLEAGPPAGSAATRQPAFAVRTQARTRLKHGSAARWGLISGTLRLKSSFLSAKHICQSPVLWQAVSVVGDAALNETFILSFWGSHSLVSETDVKAINYTLKETVMRSLKEGGNNTILSGPAEKGGVGSRVAGQRRRCSVLTLKDG